MKRLATTALILCLLTIATCEKGLDLFPGEEWRTGYLTASDNDKALFYYLFRCRNKTIVNPPLLIWLEGGPGYTSAAGIYMHGGPYIVDNMTGEIVRNNFSWNNVADVVYVDQPAGTSFSYSNEYEKMCKNMTCVVDDLQSFLHHFFAAYPEYNQRKFAFMGTSYAGHFIPAISKRILGEEAEMKSRFMGVVLFNGFFDVFIQSAGNLKFLHDIGLINLLGYALSTTALTLCKAAVYYNVSYVSTLCGEFDLAVYYAFRLPNDPYNVEQESATDPYETAMEPYLNLEEVQRALGVNMTFAIYNWTVFDYLTEDMRISYHQDLVPALNSGLKVYLVHGAADYVCSYVGGIDVAHDILWDGKKQFSQQTFSDWNYKGTVLGQSKAYKNLKFVSVYHAGHSIFYRQRDFGLEIIRDFLESSTAL